MVIDSHQHFWIYDSVRDSWINDEMSVLKRDFLPTDLAPVLKEHGIDGCISVQADQSENETLFLLELAGKNECVKGVVGWVDLKSNNLADRLAHFSSFPKLKGFRHIIQGEKPGFMLDDKLIDGVRKLKEFGFTYDLLIYHHQLTEALEFLSRTDGVRIVIDHLAKPSIRTREKTHWDLNTAAAGSFSNVFCKLSGMVTEANWHRWTKEEFFPYMDEVFEIFGPGRIMYGSDWPVCLLAGQYVEQLGIVTDYLSRLSENEKGLVMGINAKTFYNL